MALCTQVQALTAAQAQSNDSPPPTPRDPTQHQEKRRDTRVSPRKSKRTHDQTADSVTKEGLQQSAPQTDDRRTVWDDCSTSENHD